MAVITMRYEPWPPVRQFSVALQAAPKQKSDHFDFDPVNHIRCVSTSFALKINLGLCQFMSIE